LGGGYGMFARKWGLTCDHLRRVKMVDGAGMIRDSNEEPDLLWSSRGGGNGHFGIVTELTYNTRTAPAQFSSWKFRAYKLDSKRATALLETWFEATSELPNEAFSAWIMNGSQVTVVVITIGSREQKGLVNFRRRLAGLTKKMTSGGPTPLKRALSWSSLKYAGKRPRTRRSFEKRLVGCAIILRKPGSQAITQTIRTLRSKTGQRLITGQKITRASSS